MSFIWDWIDRRIKTRREMWLQTAKRSDCTFLIVAFDIFSGAEYPYYEKVLTNRFDVMIKYNYLVMGEYVTAICNLQEPKK